MFRNKMLVFFMFTAVLSLACAGCSDDDPVTPTSYIDEAPLVPPTKLSVDLDKGKATLKWGPSVDSRTVNYFVDRETDGVRTNLGRTGKHITNFVDENPAVGFSTYYVYATGSGPRKSAAMSVSLTFTLTHQTSDMHR